MQSACSRPGTERPQPRKTNLVSTSCRASRATILNIGYWLDMADGKLEGLFVMGQNPAVGAANGRLERSALANLKWLVVRDFVETETAAFWKDSPEVERGELDPRKIATEIFLLARQPGTRRKTERFTNTQRLIQFHEKAVDPPEDCRSETWFMYHLGRRLKAKRREEQTSRNAALNALTWDYATEGPACRAETLKRSSAKSMAIR